MFRSSTPTVGVEFYKAELQLTDAVHATLQARPVMQQQVTERCLLISEEHLLFQVWDIGSNVSSLSMAANYLHGCDAVLAVHDITRPEVSTPTFHYTAAHQCLVACHFMYAHTLIQVVL